MNPTLERVARAIYADMGKDDDWDTLPAQFHDAFVSAAKAALTALLEPDEGMVEAGDKAVGDICSHWPEAARDLFTAMFRQALNTTDIGEG